MKQNMLKVLSVLFIALSLLFVFGITTLAANTGMPWEGPMEQILGSITGPVAKFVSVCAIIAAGFSFFAADEGHVLKKVLGIVFGCTIAFGAVSWFLPMLGFAGGVAF